MSWTDERVEPLKKMWNEGQSASQIAKELGGVTRNAVIGKVHRLGLSNRAGGARARSPRPTRTRASAEPVGDRGRDARAAAAPDDPAARAAGRVAAAPADHPGGPAAAAAALGQRDQPRGAGLGPRGREEGAPHQPDGPDRAHLQMADRRSRDRGLLVLRPAGAGRQALLRGPCRRGVPADELAPRPQALGAPAGAASASAPSRERRDRQARG